MTIMNGGTAVESGYYWNTAQWSLVTIARGGDALPGNARERYVKVPLPVAFALVPVMGALFVFFLPFIGFALTLQAAVRPLTALFKRSATDLAATVTPGWQPGEAHFTGKRSETRVEEKGPPASGSERLEKLQREIDERRRDEK